jgi:hypothetical protein
MGQALRNKFKGMEESVVNYTKTYGIFKACDKFQTGYLSMQKFIEESTGDPNCGLNPESGLTNGEITVKTILDGFVNKILQMQAENNQLVTELNQLRTELDYRKHQENLQIEPKVVEVLRLCRTNK